MARIKIEIPAKTMAVFYIPVRIADINYGNHVGNDSFVAIIHEARIQWLQQYGYTELQVENTGLIMSDLALEFKNESVYGDVIEINISIGEISRVSFEIYYKLSANRNNLPLVLAHAKTGMVCFDYAAKKVAPIPEKFLKILLA